MCIKNTKKRQKIQENMKASIVSMLQKDGYHVKTNLKYFNNVFGRMQTKYGKYTIDIFAYKGNNDILVVEFEDCVNILSRENENKWKYLISKPGLDLHIIVPFSCKEKAYIKSRIKNIPLEIHCDTDWKNIFEKCITNHLYDSK